MEPNRRRRCTKTMRRFLALAGLLALGTLVVPTPVHAGGGCHSGSQPNGSGTTVSLAMNCMTPRVLHSSTGRITFVNKDSVMHNLVGESWGVDELRKDASYVHDFSPGTHAYSCTLHPGMVGAVVIGDGVGAVTPVANLASTPTAASASAPSDRLPLGLALGALAGIAATIAALRIRLRLSR